jgi:hypothetical protein
MYHNGSGKVSLSNLTSWLWQDLHKERVKELCYDMKRAFTEHPQNTEETYLQHLCFNTKMSARFAFVSSAIMLQIRMSFDGSPCIKTYTNAARYHPQITA